MRHLVFGVVFLVWVVPCAGRVISVDDDGPADFNNIQAAINDANNGDVVVVLPGTYTGDGNRDIEFLGKAITVRSVNPNNSAVVAATIIDCNATEADPHRGFHFDDHEGPNSVAAGFTITNGYGPYYISHSGDRSRGGAISCWNSSPTIKNCILTGNAAYHGGGAIYCSDSYSVISACIISDNNAHFGGGGLQCIGGSVIVVNCNFSRNIAGVWGGAVADSYSGTTFDRCIFSGNTAGYFGGGIACDFYSGAELANCVFIGNWARHGNAVDCNSVGQSYPSNVRLSNCILWDGGNEIRNNDGSAITVNYANIDGGESSCYDPCDMIEWGPGNVDVDPCFVKPGKWVDVNEPNIVVEPNDPNAVWVDGDYHLKSEGWRLDMNFDPPRWGYDYVTSRCIDAGNPGSPLRNELLTIPGDPGHVWGRNLRINMGAYGGTRQASMPPYDWTLLADITNDGLVNGSDFAHQATDWLINGAEQPGDLNRNGIVDTNDVGLFVGDWLETTSWHE